MVSGFVVASAPTHPIPDAHLDLCGDQVTRALRPGPRAHAVAPMPG